MTRDPVLRLVSQSRSSDEMHHHHKLGCFGAEDDENAITDDKTSLTSGKKHKKKGSVTLHPDSILNSCVLFKYDKNTLSEFSQLKLFVPPLTNMKINELMAAGGTEGITIIQQPIDNFPLLLGHSHPQRRCSNSSRKRETADQRAYSTCESSRHNSDNDDLFEDTDRAYQQQMSYESCEHLYIRSGEEKKEGGEQSSDAGPSLERKKNLSLTSLIGDEARRPSACMSHQHQFFLPRNMSKSFKSSTEPPPDTKRAATPNLRLVTELQGPAANSFSGFSNNEPRAPMKNYHSLREQDTIPKPGNSFTPGDSPNVSNLFDPSKLSPLVRRSFLDLHQKSVDKAVLKEKIKYFKEQKAAIQLQQEESQNEAAEKSQGSRSGSANTKKEPTKNFILKWDKNAANSNATSSTVTSTTAADASPMELRKSEELKHSKKNHISSKVCESPV
jgi:hypothetical protein